MKYIIPGNLETFRKNALDENAPLHVLVQNIDLLESILRSSESEFIGALTWFHIGTSDPSEMAELLPSGLSELEVTLVHFSALDFYAKVLPLCPKLEKIHLCFETVPDPDFGAFFRALDQSSVRDLHVYCHGGAKIEDALSVYLPTNRLRRLQLNSSKKLYNFGQLDELVLHGGIFEQALTLPPTLHKLTLRGCRFRPDESFEGLENVRDLEFSGEVPNLGPTLHGLLQRKVLDRLSLATNDNDIVSLLGDLLGQTKVLELQCGWGNKWRVLWFALTSPHCQVQELVLHTVNASVLGWLKRLIDTRECHLRKLTLKPSDLDYYRGERGRRGAKLPRGLQRVDRIEIEPAAGAEPATGENLEG